MKYAPRLSEQTGDIQAMLGSGFGKLTGSRFWLLTVQDPVAARAWLDGLAGGPLVKSIEAFRQEQKTPAGVSQVVAVAFSYAGLQALGCAESDEFPFPTPFCSGMGSKLREDLLRDSPREQWRWSDAQSGNGREPVHVLVAHWWNTGAQPPVAMLQPDGFNGCFIDGEPGFLQGGKLFEPFGFRDGLSQPVIYGLRDDVGDDAAKARLEAGALYEDRVVAPGEFIVGYRNEYNQLTYSPDLRGWRESHLGQLPNARFSLNGSYLAVRQIEQNVDDFDNWDKPLPSGVGCPAAGVTMAEKLMGRRRDGAPLEWNKVTGPVSDSQADAFRYCVADANGFITPRGAHIRRVNPRDMLGHDVESGIAASKLHRLLRRGRPYRELDDDKPSQGLFFIACNADLERQFEFVHQRWLRNPRFADLDNEDDPIVGAPVQGKRFTMPGLPSGEAVSLQAFTRTLGGGYFFLPGLKALRFIASAH